MKLSLTHPCSWTLLLILVSSLLLWEDVASVSTCLTRNGNCFVSMEEMLDQGVRLAENINSKSLEMFTGFDSQYAQSQKLINKNFRRCHTSSLNIPKAKSKALRTHPLILLKLVESLLGAWKVPLYHLVKEMSSMKHVSPSILNKARDIEEKNTGLLEGIKVILSMIDEDEENENIPAWSGLASLQANNDDRLFAIFNLIHCVYRDTQDVGTLLKVVKCQVLRQNNC